VDNVPPDTRSRIMGAVAGANTKPELSLRRLLHESGLRFRLHRAGLPGRPDIVLPKHRAVVFVHGCFWHRHEGCPRTTTPATRAAFWRDKFAANVARDGRTVEALLAAGWRVAVVWECALSGTRAVKTGERAARWVRSNRKRLEIP
jgi:DNA mismatch endonuclease (patch repair protein)